MTLFKKKKLIQGMLLVATVSASAASQAAIWSSTSVLLEDGSGYKDVSNNSKFDADILTLEHVDGWKYGTNFFFIDATNPNSSTTDFYGEFSPSFSLGKMTGKDLSFGFVKDVSLTGTWEVGQVSNAKLFGLGFDLNVPGVPVATVNVYQRFSESKFYSGKTGSAPQVTLVWGAPFHLGSTSWLFEGFLDYALAEKEVGKKENIVSQPRLLLDAGALWGAPKQLYAGVEYSYWHNKYGTDGVDEGVPQATIKWTF